jgi:hypothetical protein
MTHLPAEVPARVSSRSLNFITASRYPVRWKEKEEAAVAVLDWSQCPAVESIPGKVSGAWVFKDTRMPVSAVFENLEAGASIEELRNGSMCRENRSSPYWNLQLAALMRLLIAAQWHRSMRILCDHGVPAPLIPFLVGHTVIKVKDAGWDRLANGELLMAAEDAHCEVLVTTDKNMRY